MIRVATVADCVQNPTRNGVACGRGFTVEHMSKGEQMQEQKMPVVAVVLAAGFGTRFDENNPKQLVSVGGKPIVCWSIEAFENNDRISDIIVVVNERVEETVNELIDEAGYAKVRAIVPGGAERVDSTLAALDLLKQAGIPSGAKILIHDGVRPFVEERSIDGCIDSLDQFNAATVAYASTDTILLTEDLGDRKVVKSVPERPNTFRAQTPQASVSAPSSKPTNWPPPTPTSTRPTTRAWWWTTCPTSRSPSWTVPKRTSKSPRHPTCRSPKASPVASTPNTPRRKPRHACTPCSPKRSPRCTAVDFHRTLSPSTCRQT